MTYIHHPSEHDTSYAAPHGPVLLLSCMDPRLLDDTVEFMNHDNLCNRYDHVILAGASLGALGGGLTQYAHWKQTFFDHLEGAHRLHRIEEVYIVEHRGCGAYSKIFKVAPEFGDTAAELEAEQACHRKYADLLTVEIENWAKDAGVTLHVRSFLMNMRGQVSLLHDSRKLSPPKK